MVNVRILIGNLAINGPAFAEAIDFSAALVPADLGGVGKFVETSMAKTILKVVPQVIERAEKLCAEKIEFGRAAFP